MKQPVLFISHGAPSLPFDDIAARSFFLGLGQTLPVPEAILVLSAHWYEKTPTLTYHATPDTIHDFFGFPPELYKLKYPAKGAPVLAGHIKEVLEARGLSVNLDGLRGYDHGAWNPLMLIYPDANIPVIQLSLIVGGNEQAHFDLGRTLKALRDKNILIIASGGAVHNLRAVEWQGGGTPPHWALEFDQWLSHQIKDGNTNALLNYKTMAPSAMIAHPNDDHLLPLFCALGAADGQKGASIHNSFAFGSLSMACYQW